MSSKPTRRRTAAISRRTGTGNITNSFWGTLADYASELAPVAGPLLDAIGQTASAIERAELRNRCVEAAAEAAEEWPQKTLNTNGRADHAKTMQKMHRSREAPY